MPSLLSPTPGLPYWAKQAYALGETIAKAAEASDTPEVAYNLAGMLYKSTSGWVLLSVPNSLVHGIFNAMHEPGVELPPSKDDGRLNAHISVIRPEELETIGGADKITERGKQFRYTLGRLKTVVPHGWSEMERVWFCEVHSPELQELRRSYGLSGLPKDGEFAFHITVAVRRKKVLGRNETGKGDV